MRRNASNALTAVMLIASVILVIVAIRIVRTGSSSGTNAQPPGSYAILPAPFHAGIVRGRLVAGTAGVPAVVLPAGCETKSAEGGVPDAIVYVEGVIRGRAPEDAGPRLSLGSCGIVPRVSAGLEGSTARVSGKGDHRLQAWVGGVRVSDATAGGNAAITLVGGGVWNLRCASGHAEEEAWVIVLANPYYTRVDAQGRFELRRIPEGTWTVRSWHPKLGERSTQVTIKSNTTEEIELRY